MTIVKHEWRSNIKVMLIWIAVVGGCLFGLMLMVPSFESQMDEMSNMFTNMGSFTQAFGMDRIAFDSATAIYAVEGGIMMSLGGAIFAAMLGSGMLAKEEGAHTAEFLMTTPNSRIKIVVQKMIAMLIILLVFNIGCAFMGIVSFAVIGEAIPFKEMLLYHGIQTVMHIEVSMICFAISAYLKRNNAGLGIGIAALFYFMLIFINLNANMKFLKYITPFYYSDSTGIFTDCGLEAIPILIGVLLTLASATIAIAEYNRKDLSC